MVIRLGEHERFDPSAFDNTVGTTISLDVGGVAYPAVIVAAEVVEGGWAALLTVDTEAPFFPLAEPRTPAALSFPSPRDLA